MGNIGRGKVQEGHVARACWDLDSPPPPKTPPLPTQRAAESASGRSPPTKKRRPSLSLRKGRATTTTHRFATSVSEAQYVQAAEGVVPANTKKNNDWGRESFVIGCRSGIGLLRPIQFLRIYWL